MPSYSPYKSNIRFILAMTALASIIFAMARPWGGVKSQESIKEGIEIVIAVDASNSMLASASGDENGLNRIRSAKLMLERLIGKLSNDRVGLIAFAGDAYSLIPVTNDYVSAKAFLNSIEPEFIPNQGTNIAAALNMAEQSFSEKGDIGKAIILLTDAEELEDVDGVLREVREATKRNIQVDVIGIGSEPVTIPDGKGGKMIDPETNEVVRTALNEQMAIDIATTGNGIYVNASNDEAIDELEKQLGKLKKSAIQASFLVTHDELYYPFVILAIVLIFIDFFITDKKNKWLDKINFFSKSKASILMLGLISFGLFSCSERENVEGIDSVSDSTLIAVDSAQIRDSLKMRYATEKEREFILMGNNQYRNGIFEKADSSYLAALGENDLSLVANLNLGVNTLNELAVLEESAPDGLLQDSITKVYKDKASAAFLQAASPKQAKNNISSKAFYNLGNLAFIEQKYPEAIKYYKEALRLNPADDMARRNLRIAQLQKNENNDSGGGEDQNNQNQDNDQQQNNNQEQPEENQPPKQDRTQINDQTSQQILDAAERKENERRMQMQTDPGNKDKTGTPKKRW